MTESKLKEATALETISGSTGFTIAATLLSAFSGNPVASLIPVLTNALASNRHKKRVEEAIKEISIILESHADELKNISDAQYKLINETVLTIFQTIEQEKLFYLKNIINNTVSEEEIESHEAVLLSRIIRDISSDEMKFLIKEFRYEYIEIGGQYEYSETLFLKEDSQDALIANGLLGLGVMSRTVQLNDSGNRLKFSNIATKLIALLKEKGT